MMRLTDRKEDNMKGIQVLNIITRGIMPLLFFSAIIYFSSCGSGDATLTPNQQTEKLLSEQVWEMNSVTIDDVSSNLYMGLTVSFTSSSYTSTNGGKLWPASGTWTFIGDAGNKIKRDDGLEITVDTINASQMILSFNWATTTSSGRITSLKGLHRMTFKRKV